MSRRPARGGLPDAPPRSLTDVVRLGHTHGKAQRGGGDGAASAPPSTGPDGADSAHSHAQTPHAQTPHAQTPRAQTPRAQTPHDEQMAERERRAALKRAKDEEWEVARRVARERAAKAEAEAEAAEARRVAAVDAVQRAEEAVREAREARARAPRASGASGASGAGGHAGLSAGQQFLMARKATADANRRVEEGRRALLRASDALLPASQAASQAAEAAAFAALRVEEMEGGHAEDEHAEGRPFGADYHDAVHAEWCRTVKGSHPRPSEC